MNVLRHAGIIIASLIFLLGSAFLCTDTFREWAGSGDVDTTSSASVILDQPSGIYLVFINKQRHTDETKLQAWTDFFEGREVSYIFEDISCCVAKGDESGLEMARSLQSRLPENQMKVRREDAILMLSKAEYGKYDIIVMSKEAADAYDAVLSFDNADTQVCTLGGGRQ